MSWQVLDDATPKARKKHVCEDCWRDIEPGENYRRVRAISEDGPRVYKSCAHCTRVLDAIWRHDPDARYYDDGIDLCEYLRDYYANTPLLRAFLSKWSGVGLDEIPLSVLWRPVGDTGGES